MFLFLLPSGRPWRNGPKDTRLVAKGSLVDGLKGSAKSNFWGSWAELRKKVFRTKKILSTRCPPMFILVSWWSYAVQWARRGSPGCKSIGLRRTCGAVEVGIFAVCQSLLVVSREKKEHFSEFRTHHFFLSLRYIRQCKDPMVLADSHDYGPSEGPNNSKII